MTQAKFNKDLVRFDIQGTLFTTLKSELIYLPRHGDSKLLSAVLGQQHIRIVHYHFFFDRDPILELF